GGLDDALDADHGAGGGAREEVVEEGIRADADAGAPRIGAVEVEQRQVEGDGGHGDQLLTVRVRRTDGPDVRIADDGVRAGSGAGHLEWQAPRRGAQPRDQHPFVELDAAHGAGLPGRCEMRVDRNGVQRYEGVDD